MTPADLRRYERRWLGRYVFRLELARQVDVLSWIIAGCVAALALWILFVRLVHPDGATWVRPMAWSAGGVTLAAMVVLFLRRQWSRSAVVPYADWHAQAGGLLMTLDERPDARWGELLRDKLDRHAPPRPSIENPMRRVLPSALFLGIVCLVPQRLPDWIAHLEGVGNKTIDRLERRVDRFKDEKLLAKPEDETLRQEIERLRQSVVAGKFGSEQWEAADAMHQRLDERVDQAVSAMQSALDAVMFSSDPATPPSSPSSPEDRRALEEAMRAMDEARLFEKFPGDLDTSMLQSALDALRSGGLPDLSMEDLARLKRLVLRLLPGK